MREAVCALRSSPPKGNKMDLEKNMARLQQISEQMSGELPLEESVKLYTEAVELTKQCREYINTAKLTIERLEAEE